MKTLRHSLVALTLLFSLQASASILPGYVTGISMLGCVMTNYTSQTQIVQQVEYQYTCLHAGSGGQYRSYYQVMPCFGNCEVESGRTLWHTNGPWTYNNCQLVNSYCTGYGYPAPTPRPSASPMPESAEN